MRIFKRKLKKAQTIPSRDIIKLMQKAYNKGFCEGFYNGIKEQAEIDETTKRSVPRIQVN